MRLVFLDACLYAHNKARSYHGVPPLTWSDNLAEGAKNWAVYLLENDLFESNPNCSPAGENLYMITTEEKHFYRVYDAVHAQ